MIPEQRTAIPVVKREPSRDVVSPTILLLDAIAALRISAHNALLPPADTYAEIEHAITWWAQAHHATIDRFDRIGAVSSRRFVGLRVVLDGRELLTLHTPEEIVEERERPRVAGTWSTP